jgi:hypothetical protein
MEAIEWGERIGRGRPRGGLSDSDKVGHRAGGERFGIVRSHRAG